MVAVQKSCRKIDMFASMFFSHFYCYLFLQLIKQYGVFRIVFQTNALHNGQ